MFPGVRSGSVPGCAGQDPLPRSKTLGILFPQHQPPLAPSRPWNYPQTPASQVEKHLSWPLRPRTSHSAQSWLLRSRLQSQEGPGEGSPSTITEIYINRDSKIGGDCTGPQFASTSHRPLKCLHGWGTHYLNQPPDRCLGYVRKVCLLSKVNCPPLTRVPTASRPQGLPFPSALPTTQTCNTLYLPSCSSEPIAFGGSLRGTSQPCTGGDQASGDTTPSVGGIDQDCPGVWHPC